MIISFPGIVRIRTHGHTPSRTVADKNNTVLRHIAELLGSYFTVLLHFVTSTLCCVTVIYSTVVLVVLQGHQTLSRPFLQLNLCKKRSSTLRYFAVYADGGY